jgi:hypothetical protein
MDTYTKSGPRKQTSVPAAEQRKLSSTSYLGVVNGTSSAYDYCSRRKQEEGAYPTSLGVEHDQSKEHSGSHAYQQPRQRPSTLLRQEGSTQTL